MRAAEPRYVLQSPELVENCVGLYVPLLEFNQLSKLGLSFQAVEIGLKACPVTESGSMRQLMLPQEFFDSAGDFFPMRFERKMARIQ